MLDCLDLNGNDTLWFQWSCDEETDDLTMQYYIGGNCTGGTLALEQSYTNDSCAEGMTPRHFSILYTLSGGSCA